VNDGLPGAESPGLESPDDGSPPGSLPGDGSQGAPTTGDARIDEVLAGLDDLEAEEIDEHPRRYAAVHEALREALASPPSDAGRDG
jgi:hypothetical protein